MNPITSWSKMTEVGSMWGIRFTFVFYRLFGERLARMLLHPITFWFFLFAPRARRASKDYLMRLYCVHGFDHAPTKRDIYRHFYAFANAALDKVAAWMGRIDLHRIVFDKQSDLYALRDSGCGAVIIGAHLGSLETARALAAHLGRKCTINAIIYNDHARRFNTILAHAHPEFAVNLIHVSQFGPETAMMLSEKIGQGELLFIMGDRTPPITNGRVTPAQFLGATALFAQGPFILASLLKCPVYLFFCLSEGTGEERRFHISFEHFTDHIDLPRKTRRETLRVLTQRYADRLDHYCRQAPLQWFNFFDFWCP